LTERDLADWANYARSVAPLPGRTRPVPAEPVRADPATAPLATPHQPAVARRSRPAFPPPLKIGEPPPGIDKVTWNRFRSGRIRPARSVDLHGHTIQRAHLALAAALRDAHAERLRCIEVITGRGAGDAGRTIRGELPLWLNLPELRPLVLAAAHPHPNNPGATRLLLRRPR
jgi:DNA-nicking Smr family endonuclease